jgi:transglutaminase-like putative cysteine protease
MRNGKTDEICMQAYLCTDTKPDRPYVTAALRIIISIAGLFGSVFSFLTCIDTGIDKLAVASAIVISVIIFGIVFTLPKKRCLTVFAVLFAVYAGVLYAMRDEFCGGLFNTANIFLSRVKSEFRDRSWVPLISPDTAVSDTQIFFILLVVFCAMLVTFGIVYRINIYAVFVSTFPLAECCLFYGLVPNYAAFFLLVASWFGAVAIDMTTFGGQGAYRNASTQCGIAAAVTAGLCVLITMLLMNVFSYSRPAAVDDLKDSVYSYLTSDTVKNAVQEIRKAEIVKKARATNNGKLGDNGNITFDNEPILEVTMPKSSETVYLRGFVGSVYTGNSWEELPKESLDELRELNSSFSTEGMNSLLLGSYNLKLSSASLPEYSFYVRNILSDSDYLYMPYNLVPESVSRYEISDDIFVKNGEKEWFGRIYDPSGLYGYSRLLSTAWNTPTATLNEEAAAYSQFVYENYLDVPANFASAGTVFGDDYYAFITAEGESDGKSTLSQATVTGRKIYYIRSWLRNNCTYTLKAGKLPSGKDFADYFVTETREGSCTHFATAAALLCRYAGIPARYVEGFVIKPEDFDDEASFGSLETVEVTDARAHAWVEVFISGYGWYPVEFTSGYGNVITSVTTAVTSETAEEVTETLAGDENASSGTAAADSTNGTSPQSDNEVPSSAVTTAPQAESDDNYIESEASSADGSSSAPIVGFTAFGAANGEQVDVVYDLTVPIVILCTIAIAAIFIVTRRIIIVKRSRDETCRDEKTAAKRIYRRFGKLARAAGIPSQGDMTMEEYIACLKSGSDCFGGGNAERIVYTALKAEFGGGCVTKEDIAKMHSAVNNASEKYLGSLSAIRRFFERFIRGIA